ncbi:MAG: IclR family transcriptional regulator [Oscillospiraceae bacterium]
MTMNKKDGTNPSMALSSNQSTEKALALLEFLASSHEPVRLIDIGNELNINQSTARRFLNTLIQCGYVQQEPKTARYFMTFKICKISNDVIDNLDLRRITHPYLVTLSKIFGESVCVAIEQNQSVVFVDVVTGPSNSLMSIHRVGSYGPMHCTGCGKILLLRFSEDEIDQYIQQKGLTRFTPNTLSDKSALLEELKKVKNNGYSCDDEECELGMRCFAYPLRNYSGEIVASISVTGPTARITQELFNANEKYLAEAAYNISKELGFSGIFQ